MPVGSLLQVPFLGSGASDLEWKRTNKKEGNSIVLFI